MIIFVRLINSKWNNMLIDNQINVFIFHTGQDEFIFQISYGLSLRRFD